MKKSELKPSTSRRQVARIARSCCRTVSIVFLLLSTNVVALNGVAFAAQPKVILPTLGKPLISNGNIPRSLEVVLTQYSEENDLLKVVLFSADWCRSCRQLEASANAAQKQMQNNSVEWIKFDMTNMKSRQRSRSNAERAGLLELYNRISPETGLLLIVDDRGTILSKITTAPTASVIIESVEENLER